MRTLVHLSDLHFGRTDAALLAPLRAAVAAARPDLVVVSGDLTQRARAREFAEARAFLETLPQPQIVVPGNHDVPLYRVWERFLSPLGKYRRIVQRDLEPSFVDDEIAVIGINTARSLTFKNGRINEAQMAAIRRRFDPLGAAVLKVVVTHHPFDVPDRSGEVDLVGRAQPAMEVFARCGVDLLLAGHFHTSDAGATSARYRIAGYAALVVQAGTATSTRARGEKNSFNLVRIQRPEVVIERFDWVPDRRAFETGSNSTFSRRGGEWVRQDETAEI
jgi:3',5'-cyclic AMP phosphodiesterase CpdA